MVTYIWTLEHLKEVAVAELGKMTEGSYQDFFEKAKATGLSKPKLIIETVLKQPSQFGLTEVVYPISEMEWAEFSRDELASYTPNVYVVDGSLYTAGI